MKFTILIYIHVTVIPKKISQQDDDVTSYENRHDNSSDVMSLQR